MHKKLDAIAFLACVLFLIVALPQLAYCQTSSPTITPTPTEKGKTAFSLPLIGGIIAAVAVVAVVALFVLRKRGNGRSPSGVSSSAFEARVIEKFNGKPSDPSTGVSGVTEGGQPLLIKEAAPVGLAEVEGFAQVLMKGKAQKGIIVAPDFEEVAFEGKMTAMDNGIELQLLRISEVMNKRYAGRIRELASMPVTFEVPIAYRVDEQTAGTVAFEERPPNEPRQEGIKPRVFISNSKTQVADQVRDMLDFLHYDYVMGDKEETTVPIADSKFGLMKDCDCAIINIAAAEQERRYSGLYILNSNVTSEINAAYLNYNTQVILLVERKVELPLNLKGLRKIEYDSDDLSFNAAMDLKKILEDFKKL